MADADVKALRDEVNRRFGKVEASFKALSETIASVQNEVHQLRKDAHNELSQARREERAANAETVSRGVADAVSVAREEAAERVSEIRDELRVWFDQIGDAFKAQ